MKTLAFMIGGLAITATLFTGCSKNDADKQVIIGDATFRERMALPEDVVFNAMIVDITDEDKAVRTIAKYEKKNAGNPPYPYRLEYKRDDLKPGRQYLLRANVSQNGTVLFTTQNKYTVEYGKAPDATTLQMIRSRDPLPTTTTSEQLKRDAEKLGDDIADKSREVGRDIASASDKLADKTRDAAATAADKTKAVAAGVVAATKDAAKDVSSATTKLANDVKNSDVVADAKEAVKDLGSRNLQETYWRLTSLPALTFDVKELGNEPHIILHTANQRLSGSDGCNVIAGKYAHGDNKTLKLTEIVSSEIGCTKGINVAGALSAALTSTAAYTINGNQLDLINAAGTVVARFTATDL